MLKDDLVSLITLYATGGGRVRNFWGLSNANINRPDTWWLQDIPFSSPNIRERDASEEHILRLGEAVREDIIRNGLAEMLSVCADEREVKTETIVELNMNLEKFENSDNLSLATSQNEAVERLKKAPTAYMSPNAMPREQHLHLVVIFSYKQTLAKESSFIRRQLKTLEIAAAQFLSFQDFSPRSSTLPLPQQRLESCALQKSTLVAMPRSKSLRLGSLAEAVTYCITLLVVDLYFKMAATCHEAERLRGNSDCVHNSELRNENALVASTENARNIYASQNMSKNDSEMCSLVTNELWHWVAFIFSRAQK
eukprot:gene11614-12815_t